MASNVIPFPMQRVTHRAEIVAMSDHITLIRGVLSTSVNPLQIEMGGVMIEFLEREIDALSHPNKRRA